MELINCHCRNKEGSITLQGLVDAGFDANIVTKTGARKLMSCGYMFEELSEGRPVRAPGGNIYRGQYMVTAAVYLKRIERRSENEEFYLVDLEPSHLLCDLVLGQDSLIGRDLTENTAAPTEFRHKTDGESRLGGSGGRSNVG
ncbi:hypothetical protein BJX96DRAFT_48125 [Aspergillus floccosus]